MVIWLQKLPNTIIVFKQKARLEWECKNSRGTVNVTENVDVTPLPDVIKVQIDAKVCL